MSSKAAVKYWYLHRPKTMRFVHETAVKIQSVGRAFAVRQLIKKYGIGYTVQLAKTDAKKKHQEWLAELSERERMEAERHHEEYEARVQETKRIRREQAEAARIEEERVAEAARIEKERIAEVARKEEERIAEAARIEEEMIVTEKRLIEEMRRNEERAIKEEVVVEGGIETTITVQKRITMEKVTIIQESFEEHTYRISDSEAQEKETLAM